MKSPKSAGDTPTRIAECAAMMIAVTRLMLNAQPRAFADWLRAVADDIEAEAKPLPVAEERSH